MRRRHFMKTLAIGLAGFVGLMKIPESLAGPLLIPVDTDENGLTPLAKFFVTAITSSVPNINLESDRLTVDGGVTRPLSLRYDELGRQTQQTQKSLLQCVGGAKGQASWEGIPLKTILESAGVGPDVKKVIFYAADGYESSIPIATALKPDSLLALTMNGESLWPKHGWPVRLVLPGKYGYKQVKWITRIELTTRRHKGFWEQRGYGDDGSIKS